MSSFDSLDYNKFSDSLPDLDFIKTTDSLEESPNTSPVHTVDPNFDINTFLSKLHILDSRSLSPDLPVFPYIVAQPSIEHSDYISSAELSGEELEETADPQITEGSSSSINQEPSGSNTPLEDQEDIESEEE